jgi:hypothetical protein
MGERAQITDPEKIRRFAVAGKARITLVSKRTGDRFTYEVKRKKADEDFYFVSVLTGPENTTSYTYLGCLSDGHFRDDRRMRIGAGAPSRQGFKWFWRALNNGGSLDQVEVWHEGRCGRCNRVLTVPESIESGLGPICAGR